MNKKILRVFFVIGLLIIFLLFINAEENLTNVSNQQNNPQDNAGNNDTIYSTSDLSTISNSELLTDITNDSENTTLESNNDSNLSDGFFIEETGNTSNLTFDNSTQDNETFPINTTISEPESSSSHNSNSEPSSENDIGYTNLEDFIQNDSNENSENSSNDVQEKKNTCSLYNPLGKRVIEIENCNENWTSDKINVQELEKNLFEKEVIVSSKEHLNNSLIINITLTTEAKKEDIKVYWKNEENLEITKDEGFSVKYYDDDNNGLIDTVSWSIPHLSEQIFDVVVGLTKANESVDQIVLNINNPPVGEVRNPINFNISTNYSGNVTCNLRINQNETTFTNNLTYSLVLNNGSYIWEVNCSDLLNSSIFNNQSGNFSVNEIYFNTLQPEKLYFLDLVKNVINNSEIIAIGSIKESNFIVEISRNGGVQLSQAVVNATSISMNQNILNSSGNYTLIAKFSKPSANYINETNFSVASANILFNTTHILEGQSVKINLNVDSPRKRITFLCIDFGDGENSCFPPQQPYPVSPVNQEIVHRYLDKGNYTVTLDIGIEGESFKRIQRNGINVTSATSSSTNVDDISPSVTLLEPSDESVISSPMVNFSYKASDNVKIQNCTFKLYGNCASMSSCSTSDSNLIFPTTAQQRTIANNYSVQNNKEIDVSLQDFEDGIYEWLVECYDNSSNYDWDIGFFKISVNTTSSTSSNISENYSQKAEIETLEGEADSFLTKDFSLEEKEVLEDLNILNDTRYYKKRLLDIQQFFEENYKYVSSETLREQKTEAYLTELEDIKNKIPKNITIIGSDEYIKNSVDNDFGSIVQEYFNSTNTAIGKSSIEKLARINKELQNEISVSAKVKNVEIVYENGTQDLTLIKKEISLNNESYSKILEVVPKEIAKTAGEITFLTENSVVNADPIFEVNYGSLDKKQIVYYINKSVNLKDLEKTDTLLFEDNLNKFEAGFTGFLVLDSSGGFTIYIIITFILLIVLFFIIPLVLRKFKMINWKKEPNVVKVLNLLQEINKLLKEKEIENAREKYYRIKEIYPVLPSKTKPYFYKKINEMLVRIDRKDIFGLVKEYQEAKRKWNKEDYMRLYEDIKKIYERLPEKDRKKVYEIINRY